MHEDSGPVYEEHSLVDWGWIVELDKYQAGLLFQLWD
jgi:hypothetical protein